MRDFGIGLVLGLVGMILWMQSFIVRQLGMLVLGRAHGPVDQLGLVAMAGSVGLMVLGPLFFWFVLPMADRFR